MKYQYTLYACQDTNISKNDPWDVNFENDQNIINFQPYKVDWFDYSYKKRVYLWYELDITNSRKYQFKAEYALIQITIERDIWPTLRK